VPFRFGLYLAAGHVKYNIAFGKGASFAGAAFGDVARFAGVAFGNGARFDGVAFGERASFTRATFGGVANFSGAAFGAKASFGDTFFKGTVEFTRTSIEQWSTDLEATVHGTDAGEALKKRHEELRTRSGSQPDPSYFVRECAL
jgi:hypothetical protein